MSDDYSKTLNLPETGFPMRANLPQKEPDILKKWETADIYRKQLAGNKGKKKFVLHDGPPYANGDIHLGTALNKILKDIVVKYYSMNGFETPYIPGWDTHGLPIEQRAIKELGLKRHETDPVIFRNACKGFALKYVNIQRESFKRLGVRADWDNPYITLVPEFEARQIEVFGEMCRKGYIYKGLRPVYWCPECETALAEAEIEYSEDPAVSIYVKFPVRDDGGRLSGLHKPDGQVYFVIWTTTTWTLPGNMAICLNADFEYSVAETARGTLIIASELLESTMKAAGISDYSVTGKVKGSSLEGIICRHPFLDRDSVVITGSHVTLETGTGCVHTAPGHGAEDFEVCKALKMDIVVPVDNKGYLTADAGMFAGMYYEKSNKEIIAELESKGYLLASERIIHQYPHCWRCQQPIIYRATEQWFASVEGFRQEAIKAIETVQWVPAWGEERIKGMVRDRSDWCISRQRIWGVPIPIFYCRSCGAELINDSTIGAVRDLFREKGSNAWYEYTAEQILPPGTACACGGSAFTKETDIMDVWFDSGSTHAAVLETREELGSPADMYLEGSDQHRGWFQSSLLTSVATRGRAPYRTVLTHGYVVDGEGRKMSKSLGNGIDPRDIIKEYGADILRLWAASSDYKTDIRISKDILRQLTEAYRKIRNTARFILGNIGDFDPDSHSVETGEMEELDRWALLKLGRLINTIGDAYREYEFHLMFHAIHNFCVVDMSNFYLDVIKDRLYTSGASSSGRRSAQTAIWKILDSLVRMLSPVLAFTAEEIWQHMPHRSSDNTESVQLNGWPETVNAAADTGLEAKWGRILEIREQVMKALEEARTAKLIGHSLNAKVVISAAGEDHEFLKAIEGDLPEIFIVSGFRLEDSVKAGTSGSRENGIAIRIEQADGTKCERCWIYSTSTGQNAAHPSLCARCAKVVESL